MNLTDGVTSLTLPDDLEWSDQYAWLPVEQSVEFSVTGALILDVGEKLAGRAITLAGNDSTAWVSRAAVDQLRAWAALPGQSLSLTLADSRVFVVALRHHDAPALDASPVLFTAPMVAGDWYVITLKFLEL